MSIHPALKALVLAVVIIFVGISQLKADDIYGRIRGTVTDPSGAVIPGVTVTATNSATGVTRSTKTGSDGIYELVNLRGPSRLHHYDPADRVQTLSRDGHPTRFKPDLRAGCAARVGRNNPGSIGRGSAHPGGIHEHGTRCKNYRFRPG